MMTALSKPTGVYDLYTRIVTGEVEPSPQALTLGYRYTAITPDKVVAEFPANKQHHTPYGWVGEARLAWCATRPWASSTT
jgi:hypothetical protein